MGCDIHSFAEVKRKNKWEKVNDEIFPDYGDRKTSEPFSWRSYSMFAFLADVRNYDHCKPLSEPKGLPKDSEWLNEPCKHQGMRSYWTEEPVKIETNFDDIDNDMNYHSKSNFTLKELLDFDYDKTFWNRRISRTVGNYTNGAALAEEGEGETVSYKENLGQGFFDVIETLKGLGKPEDVRIIFWFDN